jgi:exopolysaccharide biosynthesis protein
MKKQANEAHWIVNFFRKPYRYATVFSLLLTSIFAFTLLDTFVIAKALPTIPQSEASGARLADKTDAFVINQSEDGVFQANQLEDAGERLRAKSSSSPTVTANSYKDANIDISIETLRLYDTDVYIADIRVSDAAYLKTAFASDTYGRNINEKTSVIAGRRNAILAVNGDFYGFRDDGWVLRNGVLYRLGGNDIPLLMDGEGRFSCDADMDSVEKQLPDLWQAWSFGPPLVVGGTIAVTKNQEIAGRSSNSNPRTAIGQAGALHYVFIVSDGRTDASAGLSLYELATIFEGRGCSVAYNLDGGGASVMFFNGQVINRPTTGGRRIGEREVSDIVYIGY